ncbi:MAG: M23 family metallopeptidase [Thermodesulfobacteriota bacterium]
MGELNFESPLNSYDEISSTFGLRDDPFTGERKHHNGIDYKIGIDNNVLASERGRVVKAGFNVTFGNVIIIDHTPKAGDNEPHIYTLYGHLKKDNPFNNIKVGDTVKKGQVIGFSGNTGKSSGPHLHFTVAHFSKKRTMYHPGDGPTSIGPSEYSNPGGYIGVTHEINGTTDDLTDKEAEYLINDRISYRLLDISRMAVLVDERIEGLIDENNKSVTVILEYDEKELEELMAGPMPPPKQHAPLNVDINIKL